MTKKTKTTNKTNKNKQTETTPARKLIASNKKARHDYTISETLQAGIELQGCEVKSLREGKANLHDSYVRFMNDELWLVGCYIAPFKQANPFERPDPTRSRKLLVHAKELKRLFQKTTTKNLTIVALKLYFYKNRVKMDIGLGQGRKKQDKRAVLKERSISREIDRGIKSR